MTTVTIDEGGQGTVEINAPGGVESVDVEASPASSGTVVASGIGPRGPRGLGAGGYTHTQVLPLTVWTIQHNLGYKAVPIVEDENGKQVLGWTPIWPSDDVLVLTHPRPLSGKAHVS